MTVRPRLVRLYLALYQLVLFRLHLHVGWLWRRGPRARALREGRLDSWQRTR